MLADGLLRIIFKFPANPAIAPASMWNRQDIVEFKSAIRKEGGEGIIKVGHGETVTVSLQPSEKRYSQRWFEKKKKKDFSGKV